ncbi:MAG TPA: cytochrome c biogenesis protein CcdA [Longimicrobiales bacterium]
MLTPALSANPLVATPLLFLSGVATSLSPCIYPLIPVTAGIVGGLSASTPELRRPRPVVLTLAYAVGLAAVYATLGLVAGLSGSIFGSVSSSWWASLIVANLLLVAGLAALEVLPVVLPARLSTWAAGLGHGRSAGGALLLGAGSGLVVAPCSAPVMAAVLTWVATTHSAALGFLYLFAFSLGMCAVLVAVGLSSSILARLPRSGPWMLAVKRTLAIVMIVAAEYYLIQAGKALV